MKTLLISLFLLIGITLTAQETAPGLGDTKTAIQEYFKANHPDYKIDYSEFKKALLITYMSAEKHIMHSFAISHITDICNWESLLVWGINQNEYLQDMKKGYNDTFQSIGLYKWTTPSGRIIELNRDEDTGVKLTCYFK
jgi:hypothetical protein